MSVMAVAGVLKGRVNDDGVALFGMAQPKREGATIPYDREAYSDAMGKALADSMRATKENVAARVFTLPASPDIPGPTGWLRVKVS